MIEEYKIHVGTAESYDLNSALQFSLLTSLGLRDYHSLLDIGCGSLRGGKLFIPYLLPERYYGIEPLEWLLQEGIKKEVGESQIEIKKPFFKQDDSFTLSAFGTQFDFVLAQSILSHTSQAQIRRCLAEAKKVMKPSTILAASFFRGLENYEGDEWVVRAEYTMDHMREMVEEQGLVCKPIEWAQPDLQQWILILHPDRETDVPEFSDASTMVQLETNLATANEKLRAIRNQPVVKFAFKIRHFILWTKYFLRNLTRGNKS